MVRSFKYSFLGYDMIHCSASVCSGTKTQLLSASFRDIPRCCAAGFIMSLKAALVSFLRTNGFSSFLEGTLS